MDLLKEYHSPFTCDTRMSIHVSDIVNYLLARKIMVCTNRQYLSKMGDVDRLRPGGTKQQRTRNLCRKYRKHRRYLQLWRLKELIPNLAQQQQNIDEVIFVTLSDENDNFCSHCQLQVLEEARLHILSLEQKLLEEVKVSGLSESLKDVKDTDFEKNKSNDGKFDVIDKFSDKDFATKNLDIKTFKSFLHDFAKQRIEKTIDSENGGSNE